MVFVDAIQSLRTTGKSPEALQAKVAAIAEESRMFELWERETILTLCFEIAASLGASQRGRSRKDTAYHDRKTTIQRLRKVCHPDLHHGCGEEEKRLWHGLLVAANLAAERLEES